MFRLRCFSRLQMVVKPTKKLAMMACSSRLSLPQIHFMSLNTAQVVSPNISMPNCMTDKSLEDIYASTDDSRIVQLSRFVMNNDLESSLNVYSVLPLFLPRSDFRIVCSLMQQLGSRCGVPDLENIFSRIQKMNLTRKHALTYRCLLRLSCELENAELISRFYSTICEEGIYVNNSFLNDFAIDCLYSLDAYKNICSLFDTMRSLSDSGWILPTFCIRSGQNAMTSFIAEGRDDLIIFFLQRIMTNWRIPVAFTDYIVSNVSRVPGFTSLIDSCLESQPKSATLVNSIVQFYVGEENTAEALQRANTAFKNGVKITSVSYKDLCDLLIVMKDKIVIDTGMVTTFCKNICSLDRGGYLVMLGVTPLEMMLLYKENQCALKYADLLKRYENGLTRKDLVVLERLKTVHQDNASLVRALADVISILNKKYCF